MKKQLVVYSVRVDLKVMRQLKRKHGKNLNAIIRSYLEHLNQRGLE